MSLFIRFQQKRLYWQIRNILLQFNFYINKIFFRSNVKLQETKEGVSLSSQLVFLTLKSILFSVAVVVILGGIEKFLVAFFPQKVSLLIISQSSLIANSSTLNSLLIAIVSVLGVFLGLYFTAISIVASSMFATVPSDVRELLLKEKVGNIYIRILSTLLATSILLLGAKVFGQQIGLFLTLGILFFGCFSVFGFVVLGLRIFNFFDPTVLVDSVFSDLYKNINLATIKGLKWNDNNFQAHYRKSAEKNIATLRDLVEFCTKAPYLQKRPLSIVLLKTSYFLQHYQRQKYFIPTNSHWFMRVPKYKDTFLSDVSALTVALQSHTSIQPEFIPDMHWLEDDVIEIIISALQSALDKKNFSVTIDVVDALNNYYEALGKDLEIERCCEICGKIEVVFEKYFIDLPCKYFEFYDSSIMALFDRNSISTMFCSLGFNRFLRGFNIPELNERINSVRWRNGKNIYEKTFPPALLERMEFLQTRLSFEQETEGQLISPAWYRKQLIVMKYGELLNKGLEQLLAKFNQYYIDGSKKYFEKKHFILTAWHVRKGLEAFAKLKAHFSQLKKIVKELEELNVEKELPWPKWDWDTLVRKIDESNDKLIEQLSYCVPSLSLMKTSDRYPDLFGETYHTICQECFSCLANNNVQKFKSIFPFLFIGSLQAHERLKSSLKSYSTEVLLLVSFEPLLDILELSGYARIYSELYNSPSFWDDCEKSWDLYFKERGDKKGDVIKMIVAFHEYRASQFRLFSRDIWKTNWKIELNNKLREMNLIDDRLGRGLYGGRTRDSSFHQSPFIRALCKGRYEPFITASEIFILSYLLKQYQGKNIDYKDKHGFVDRLNKETSGANEKNGHTKRT